MVGWFFTAVIVIIIILLAVFLHKKSAPPPPPPSPPSEHVAHEMGTLRPIPSYTPHGDDSIPDMQFVSAPPRYNKRPSDTY